jgi:hypothetical protein
MIIIQKYNIFKYVIHMRNLSAQLNLNISSDQLRPISLAAELKNKVFWAVLIEARVWSPGFWTNAHH